MFIYLLWLHFQLHLHLKSNSATSSYNWLRITHTNIGISTWTCLGRTTNMHCRSAGRPEQFCYIKVFAPTGTQTNTERGLSGYKSKSVTPRPRAPLYTNCTPNKNYIKLKVISKIVIRVQKQKNFFKCKALVQMSVLSNLSFF